MQLKSGSFWLITYTSGKQYIAEMWYNGNLHIAGDKTPVDFSKANIVFLADSVQDLVSRLRPKSNTDGVSFLP